MFPTQLKGCARIQVEKCEIEGKFGSFMFLCLCFFCQCQGHSCGFILHSSLDDLNGLLLRIIIRDFLFLFLFGFHAFLAGNTFVVGVCV